MNSTINSSNSTAPLLLFFLKDSFQNEINQDMPCYQIISTTNQCLEPDTSDAQDIFGHSCGIPTWDSVSATWFARAIPCAEFLSIYSHGVLHLNDSTLPALATVSNLFTCSIPFQTQFHLRNSFINTGITDMFTFQEDTQVDSMQCF